MTQDSGIQPPPIPPMPSQPETVARETLREIAMRQKVILFCILAYFVAVAMQFTIPVPMRPLLGLAVLGLGVVAAVFIFLLATRVYSTGIGVLLGILTLIPLVGLIVLLIVNGKATATLKASGVRVGLLGASLSDI